MAFRGILIVVAAVFLLQVEAGLGRSSRRSQNQMVGGWQRMNPADVPEDVSSKVEQRMIEQINSANGVRMARITRAKYQVVSGTNYKLVTLFHVTSCPSSTSQQDVRNESVCPKTSTITCNVQLYVQLWTQTFQVTKSKCVP